MKCTISGDAGMSAKLSSVGASMLELWVPNRDGVLTDVVLGLATEDDYRDNPTFMGATVGRVVNRIGGASFSLDGRDYPLTANDGPNCNHSGRDFWAFREWELVEAGASHAVFSLVSPAFDQGFPGEVKVRATYRMRGSSLEVSYAATTSERTLINLTNHAYFNLNGHASGDAMGHVLEIASDTHLVSDETVLPTGQIAAVKGTAWDFCKARPIRDAMPTSGYDCCYVLGEVGTMRRAARLVGNASGIAMDLFCDQPGVQLYTANFTDENRGKGGAYYRPREAVCLEPCFYPDAINHASWPQPVFSPERPYMWRMRLDFSVA